MEFKLAVLPGDGIGPAVIAEAVRVLEAVGRRFGHDFELSDGAIGGNAIDSTGTALPDETQELCDQADAVLFRRRRRPQVGRPQGLGPARGRHPRNPPEHGPLREPQAGQGRARAGKRQPDQERTGLKAWT